MPTSSVEKMTFLERFQRPKVLIPSLVGLAICALLIGATIYWVGSKNSNVSPIQKLTSASSSSTQPNPPCPLTGTPSPNPQVPARPALAVKIDNYPAARPQTGLNQADVVFEEPVEGGITRLVAVYQCQQPPLVGPIRSAREPDVAIVDLLSRPIFIHVGGIPPIESMMASSNSIDEDLFYDGSLVIHPSGRQAPYDTYISPTSAWAKYSSDGTAPSPLFQYSPSQPPGPRISSANVPFSPTNNNTWTWSQSTNDWDLSIGGSPATDISGNQLTAENVLILTVETFQGPWVENSLGAHEVEVNPTSGGPFQLLRNGVDVSGTWSRSSLSSPLVLSDANGNPVSLAPGRTWIEMLPSPISPTTSPASSNPSS